MKTYAVIINERFERVSNVRPLKGNHPGSTFLGNLIINRHAATITAKRYDFEKAGYPQGVYTLNYNSKFYNFKHEQDEYSYYLIKVPKKNFLDLPPAYTFNKNINPTVTKNTVSAPNGAILRVLGSNDRVALILMAWAHKVNFG